jgi:Tol biopolymer transport system component/DNA-binding winged helix-turn-helix (wHTH) protein
MVAPAPSAGAVTFADFELNVRAGELRHRGQRVALPEQPLRLLEVLVEHAGEVVSREQLRQRLWSADTFVDFEHGLNAAVKRLRHALGDSAESPRFIETIPKRGYRFITPVEIARPATSPVEEAGGPRSRRRLAGVLLAVVAATAAAAAWWAVEAPSSRETARDGAQALTRLTFEPGLQTDPTFSPDGRYIAYASNSSDNFDIWIQPLDGGAAVQLTDDPAHDTQPDWSPDGRTILFRSERDGGGIFAIAPGDPHVTRLTTFGYGPAWSPDGASIAFGSGTFTSGNTLVAARDGSNVAAVARQTEPGALSRAVGWHPDGRLVWLRGAGDRISLVWSRRGREAPVTAVIAESVRRRFATLGLGVVENERLAWADENTMLFVGEARYATDIWRVTVNAATLAVTDGPVRVTTGPEVERALTTTPRGGVAFSATVANRRVWIHALDGEGRLSPRREVAVTSEAVSASEPALSPDGRRLVVRIDHPGGGRPSELREQFLDEARARTLRVIDGEREDVRYPRWSPDGTRLAYSYRHFEGRGGSVVQFDSAVKALNVRSLQETFVTSPWSDGTIVLENPWSWSADGRSLLVTSTRYRPPQFALARLPVSDSPRAEATAHVLVADPRLGIWQASESPDGRWVCYNATAVDNSAVSSVLYLVLAGGGAPRRLLSGTSWDDKPRWSSDGRRLYFLSTRGGDLNVWSIAFDPQAGRPVGEPAALTSYGGPAETLSDHIGGAELSVAGSRLAVLVHRLNGGIWILE